MPDHAFPIDVLLEPADVAALCLDLERCCQTAASALAAAWPRPKLLDQLLERARAAARRAHAPYSHLGVGAALVDRQGRVLVGCNVENASFGLTQCAERSALCSARLVGAEDFAVLVVTSTAGAISPCGACRQVMRELAPTGLVVAADDERMHVWRVPELLPDAFDASGLPDAALRSSAPGHTAH